MKKQILILILIGYSCIVKAQTAKSKSLAADTVVYTKAQEQPVPPGGIYKFEEYLKTTIKDRADNGRVIISFIVEKNGFLNNIRVRKGVSKTADAEAIRLIQHSQKWKPAIQNGDAVRYLMILPITFGGNED